jgi:hypothetical protein
LPVYYKLINLFDLYVNPWKFIMVLKKIFLLILIIAYFGGCSDEITGIDPPKTKLFFPTGIMLSQNQKTLFVTNGNSDLKYNGSTLIAIDVDKVKDSIDNPLSQSNCIEDPAHNGEFKCDLNDDLIQGAIRLGSYAGNMVQIDGPANSSITYRVLVSVRAEPSITWVDVYTDGDGKVLCLDCGSGCEGSFPQDCKSDHKITLDDGLVADPYRMRVTDNGYLIVTHLSNQEISVIDTWTWTADDKPYVEVVSGVLSSSAGGSYGSYDSIQETMDSSSVLVSNSVAPEIVRLKFQYSESDGMEFLVPSQSYSFQAPYGPFELGTEFRGLALSTNGNRLYAVVKSPPMLLTLDMNENEFGVPSMDLISMTELPSQPSLLKVSNSTGYDLVYIVSYIQGEMFSVDPELGDITDKIQVGTGPHEFIQMPSSIFDGFITVNFGEGTLSFIEKNNGLLRRVGRYGDPQSIGN